MAAITINSLCSSLSSSTHLSLQLRHTNHPSSLTPTSTQNTKKKTFIIRATSPDLLGDVGARDPFPAELESNFADKVIGNMDTEHKILIPTTSALSLSQQSCSPLSPLQSPMTEHEAKQLLFKLVGWRLIEDEEDEETKKKVLKLHGVWKLRDFKCGVELINRIGKVAEEAGHFPVLHLEKGGSRVRAEIWSEIIGGLSFNDFVLAAKIDEIRTSDLIPKKRVWA